MGNGGCFISAAPSLSLYSSPSWDSPTGCILSIPCGLPTGCSSSSTAPMGYYCAHSSGGHCSSMGPYWQQLPQTSCSTAGFSSQAAALTQGLLLQGLSMGHSFLLHHGLLHRLHAEMCSAWCPMNCWGTACSTLDLSVGCWELLLHT